MSIDRPWMLIVALAPIVWGVLMWTRATRRTALALKALSLAAILAAIAGPRIEVTETKLAVAILVDTSASVSDADLTRASGVATAMEREKGRHWTKVIPFARSARDSQKGESGRGWKFQRTSGETGRATDLEAGVREAIASLPPGLIPRLVLVSDGKENRGSIARAAWQAKELGVPVDTIALAGREKPELRLEALTLPSLAFTGERFPVDLVVTAPKAGAAEVEITAEGRTIGKNPVTFEAGENRLRVYASLNTPGALDLGIAIRSKDAGEVRLDQAITMRRPKALYFSGDPAGTETHLLQTLAAAQFDIERSVELAKANFADYQLLVFNNWDLEAIPADRKEAIERFVQQGGGLLVIGGEKNQYIEGKLAEDALDRVLPAKLAPPRAPEGTCLVLILDKSSSMEGRKMELARLSAIGVIDNLRAVDLVGVLIFDNSFQWAVPIRRAEDRTLIKRLVAGVTPDGGTQIAPALAEAYRKIMPVNATYKHVVLLTDGISEEGDSLDLAREAALKRVTISTVGLGQDVNRAYLEKVAQFAGGKSYFLNDPSGLEKILLRDVMEHTGSTTVERTLKAAVAKRAEILEGVGMESAPALKGYVKFIAKPTAETLLTIDQKDPLLSRWQTGLGRAAVFASDAKSRWAADWVTWQGFDRFWTNLFRDLLPHTQAGEASLTFDSANSDLVVEYRLARGIEEPKTIPGIFVLGSGGFQKPVPVSKVAAGTFRGRVPIGDRQGLFRVRPLVESRTFPETGLYRPEAELSDWGSNPGLLKNVAEFTGGRFNPPPGEVFQSRGKSVRSMLRLWPGLLALAILLNLIELVMRKWKGIFRSQERPAGTRLAGNLAS